MIQELQNRPLSTRSILKLSWNLLSSNWRIYLQVVLFVVVPINLIRALNPVYFLADRLGSFLSRLLLSSLNISLFFLEFLVLICIAFITEELISGQETSFGRSIKFSFSRWPSVVALLMVLFLILLGISIPFVLLPDIFIYILAAISFILGILYLWFSLLPVALRNINGLTALRYDHKLIKKYWQRIFAIQIWLAIVFFVVWIPVYASSLLVPSLNNLSNITLRFIVALFNVYIDIALILLFLNLDYLENPSNHSLNA